MVKSHWIVKCMIYVVVSTSYANFASIVYSHQKVRQRTLKCVHFDLGVIVKKYDATRKNASIWRLILIPANLSLLSATLIVRSGCSYYKRIRKIFLIKTIKTFLTESRKQSNPVIITVAVLKKSLIICTNKYGGCLAVRSTEFDCIL